MFFVHRLQSRARDGSTTGRNQQSTDNDRTNLLSVESQPAAFRYLEEFKVLLCTTCQYCVLPQAVDQHLKRIHHLPWNNRQEVVEQVTRLDLVNISDISHPLQDRQPVDGLPILDGLACMVEECGYLCVATKRMQAHLREEHFPHTTRILKDEKPLCRRTKIQTLFRGNHLRYFEVASSPKRGSPKKNQLPLLKSPISAADEGETSSDWMLIQRFCEYDYRYLIPVKGTQPSWRDRLVQSFVSAKYLKYAILSMTACQIAFNNSSSRQSYRLEANRYRESAIREFPIHSGTADSRTFFEIFNFSRLMTMCYIAQAQFIEIQDAMDGVREQVMLPSWISVQRQGRALTWERRGQGRIVDALQGPAQQLFAVYNLPAHCTAYWPHERALDDLLVRLEGLHAQDPINSTCFDALELLRRAWTIPYQNNTVGFRDMALMWTARVSDEFLHLIQVHHPAAMVVFAYYCVLWSSAEDLYWYMKGHAKIILSRIVRHLGHEWQEWIKWPIEVVLTEHD